MQGFSTKLQPSTSKTTPMATTTMTTMTSEASATNLPTLTLLQTQTTSPELENLENNIKKLESDLHEARSRNIYLSDLVETQKKSVLQA